MAAASRPDWKSILQTNRPELLKKIDTENGLFGQLLRYPCTFYEGLVKRLWDEKDVVKRVDGLLDHVKSGNKKRFQDFCQALKDTGQQDVVDDCLQQIFVPQRDEIDDDERRSNELPLSNVSRRKINEHWNDIVNNMDSSTSSLLLHELEISKVLTALEAISLKNFGQECKRNEKIIESIKKGSEKKFQDFCAALMKCNQGHIVTKMNEPSVEVTQQLPPSSSSSSCVNIIVALPTMPTYSTPCTQESSVHHPAQEVTLPEDGRHPVEESQETHHPAAIVTSISGSSQPCFQTKKFEAELTEAKLKTDHKQLDFNIDRSDCSASLVNTMEKAGSKQTSQTGSQVTESDGGTATHAKQFHFADEDLSTDGAFSGLMSRCSEPAGENIISLHEDSVVPSSLCTQSSPSQQSTASSARLNLFDTTVKGKWNSTNESVGNGRSAQASQPITVNT